MAWEVIGCRFLWLEVVELIGCGGFYVTKSWWCACLGVDREYLEVPHPPSLVLYACPYLPFTLLLLCNSSNAKVGASVQDYP